ncbi:MAG TPA: phosphate starvation-inducible protein PhoH, partial [Sulfitobacter sp.]|nr:phosphate starvation-inducible protein PhoH [Sulfitobacter sp.]
MASLQESVIEFPDNMLLIDLCGEYDRNLAEIERKLGVQIVRRGNHLSVMGEDGPVREATGVLQALYSRLESGRAVE